MQLSKLAKSLTAALMLSSTVVPARATDIASAHAKLRLCRACDMPAIPVALPRRGIVLSFGSMMSDTSLWYLVDLERAEGTRVEARLDGQAKKLNVIETATRLLQPQELTKLTQLTNRAWASPDGLPTRMATDVVWDIWFLDADDVRHEFAAGLPDGLAKEIGDTMFLLLGRKTPSQLGAPALAQ
jgi:hypothetical protein